MATLLLLFGAYGAWSLFSKGTPRVLGSGPGSIKTMEAGREASHEAKSHGAGQERALGTPKARRLAQTSPPFVAYFDKGTVALLALSHPPLTNTACWHAGGRLLGTPFPEKSGSSDNWDKDNGTIILAFRVHNEGAHGISRPVFRTGEKSGIVPQSWTWQALDARSENGIFFQTITGMELNQYSSLSLGFANSAWDMAITLGHGVKSMNGSRTSISTEGSWTVGYEATPAGGGDIIVDCVYSKK